MIYRQSLSTAESQERRERRKQAQLESQIRAGVSLDGETDLKETTRRVRLMANVEKLDVYLEESFCDEDIEEFFSAVASLPKIHTVRLRCSSYRCHGPSIKISALETLLKSPGLKCLHLHHLEFALPEEVTNQCPLLAIAKLMEDNNSLKELRVNTGISKIPRDSQQALLDMLQYKNYSLESLELDDRSMRKICSSKRKQMDFYLTLNRTARIRPNLLHAEADATSQQWKDAVISNRSQCSTVYYLLSNNPTMVCCA